MAIENHQSVREKQTIKRIIAKINENSHRSERMDSNSDSEMCESSTIEFVDKPPLKTSICYSINQVEVSYTFAAHFEGDNFIRKIFNLLKTRTRQKSTDWQPRGKKTPLPRLRFEYLSGHGLTPRHTKGPSD